MRYLFDPIDNFFFRSAVPFEAGGETTLRHVNTLPRNAPDKTPLKLYFPPVIRSVTKSNRLSIMKFSRKKRSMYNS